jgi:cytochrome c oxidase subunit 2
MKSKLRQLRVVPLAAVAAALTSISGCSGIQSALDPAGLQSARINRLWWLMFWTCLVVFLTVMGALIVAMQRGRTQTQAGSGSERKLTNVVAGAIAVTVVILFGLMVSDYVTGRALFSLHSPDAITVKVSGQQWWWDFEYQDPIPSRRVRTANEIHIPVGRPVKFEMTSKDVIHSFWVPNLHGKTDLLTGHQTVTWLQADRAGKYRGQCAEYCGHQHAHMAFVVIAEPAEQFNTWFNNQISPAQQPASAGQQRGQRVFLTRTCVMCHQIRGTDAGARTGPDLTHLASRESIAAGTLANNRENLRDWIVDSHRFKPGNRMPSHDLSGEDLNALLDYLESLK